MKQQLLQQQLVQYEGGQHSTLSNAHQLVQYRNSAASKSAASDSATSHRATLIQRKIKKSNIK